MCIAAKVAGSLEKHYQLNAIFNVFQSALIILTYTRKLPKIKIAKVAHNFTFKSSTSSWRAYLAETHLFRSHLHSDLAILESPMWCSNDNGGLGARTRARRRRRCKSNILIMRRSGRVIHESARPPPPPPERERERGAPAGAEEGVHSQLLIPLAAALLEWRSCPLCM